MATLGFRCVGAGAVVALWQGTVAWETALEQGSGMVAQCDQAALLWWARRRGARRCDAVVAQCEEA